ncbi:MAG TPA: phosphatidylinositol mannoside acyltransferase [Acidimicrobiia bacterium]
MKHALTYLALRAGVGLVGLLPGSVARALGVAAGFVWYLFDGGRRRMATRHMTRVLDDPSRARTEARRVLMSYGRYWAEALWARERRVPGMLANTRVDGLERILEARDQGKGMIYALPHMGNWEAAAPIAGAEGIPVVAVAENLPNKRVTDWFTRMRADFGIEIVLATGRAEVMRKLEAALAANKAVALLSDRDLRGRGVSVKFFGEVTTLPPGPATLAIRTGAPLFPVACYFDGSGHRVVVRPPIPIPEGLERAEQVRQMTEALAQEMEDLIRQAPNQWHLVVPNWPSDR